MTLIPTAHFKRKMAECGFTIDQIIEAFNNPRAFTYVKSRPEFAEKRQRRVCGAGVAIIVEPVDEGWLLRTVYADRIYTPLREDQKDDEFAIRSERVRRAAAH